MPLLMVLLCLYLSDWLGFKKFLTMTAMIVSLHEWKMHHQLVFSNRTSNLLELIYGSSGWEYKVFSGQYFPVFGVKSLYSARTRGNTNQKNLRIWALFTQWSLARKSQKWFLFHNVYWPETYNNEIYFEKIYLVNLRIQFKGKKTGARKTSITDLFYGDSNTSRLAY